MEESLYLERGFTFRKDEKRMKKKLTGILVIFMVLLGISKMSLASDEIVIKTNSYSDPYTKWLNLPEEVRENTLPPATHVSEINLSTLYGTRTLRSLGASTHYDLRDEIDLLVKNQGATEFCWAFVATTVAESYMAKVENIQVEYSPTHMEYATSKTFLDGENPVAYNREVNGGGNILLAYPYMTSGRGPVLETAMPFTGSTEKINLAEIENKQVEAKLEKYQIFPAVYKEKSGNTTIYTNGQTGTDRREYTTSEITAFRNQIKDHIRTYGAVTAQVNFTNTEYYNNPQAFIQSTAYYCDDPSVIADHQVSIIGWDDTYAVTNFNEEHRPSKPGAYIAQSSYGTEIELPDGSTVEVFDEGVIYISYEDVLVENCMTGIIQMSEVDYDTIYQYDELGMNNMITTNAEILIGANVFQKDSGKPEWLNEISFYPIEGCTYKVYVNAQDGELNKQKLVEVAEIGEITGEYYTTVTLEEPILLTGSEFVVAMQYVTDESQTFPVESIYGYSATDYYATAKSNPGESFICVEPSLENWADLAEIVIPEMREINLCLKAFTTQAEETDIYVTSQKYQVSQADKKITEISPNTTLADFEENILTNTNFEIYDKDNNLLTQTTDRIGTSASLRIPATGDVYQLVVTGDLNGDGRVTGTDLLKVKRHIVKLEILTGSYLEAADVNFSDSITSTDLLKIKQAIVGLLQL